VEFATAWRRWLAKTGRERKTYRPLFGSPVRIDTNQPPDWRLAARRRQRHCRELVRHPCSGIAGPAPM